MTLLSTTDAPPTTSPAPIYDYYHQQQQNDIQVVEKSTTPAAMVTDILSVPTFQLQNSVVNLPHEETERIAAAQSWARSLSTTDALAISKIHLILYNEELVVTSAQKHRSDIFLDLTWSPAHYDQDSADSPGPKAAVDDSQDKMLLRAEIAYMETRGYGAYLENIYKGVVKRMNQSLRDAAGQSPQDRLASVFDAFKHSYLYLF